MLAVARLEAHQLLATLPAWNDVVLREGGRDEQGSVALLAMNCEAIRLQSIG